MRAPAGGMPSKRRPADLARVYGLKTPMTQAAADTAKVWVAGWEKAK
jgi:hypothetical protein